jgi:hypothetical protein
VTVLQELDRWVIDRRSERERREDETRLRQRALAGGCERVSAYPAVHEATPPEDPGP